MRKAMNREAIFDRRGYGFVGSPIAVTLAGLQPP